MGRKLDQFMVWLAGLSCFVFIAQLNPLAPRGLTAPEAAPPAVVAPPSEDASEKLVVRTLSRSGAAQACPDENCDAPAALRPVVGALVLVFQPRDQSYPLTARGQTGANGRIELGPLSPGPAWVVVHAPRLGRRAVLTEIRHDMPALQILLDTPKEMRVAVRDESGAPIAKATVLISGADALPFGELTDDTGLAVLSELYEGPWDVTVAARGFESVARNQVSDDQEVVLRRLGGFDIEVLDSDGSPADGAVVWMVGPSLWPARSVTSDAQGRATVSGLLRGPYNFRAQKEGRVSQTVVGIPLGTERKAITLRLEPGRFVEVLTVDGDEEDALPVPGAEVVLTEYGVSPFPLEAITDGDGRARLGPIPSGPATLSAHAEGFVARAAVPVPEEAEPVVRLPLRRGGTILGEVVDERDDPIDGARVEVVGTDLDGLPVAETPWSQAVRRGHFEFAMAPPSPLLPIGELGVMMGPIPPVPGITPAQASFTPTTIDDAWVTGLDGRFRARPVPPGRLRVLVRHPQYLEAVSEPVRVGPGEERTVRIKMLRGQPLRGRVLDDAGLPLAEIRVEAVGQRGLFQRSVLSRPDGTFEFVALPKDVTISISRPDTPTEVALTMPVKLAEVGDDELELVLDPIRDPTEVTVLDAHGDPIELAQVTFLSLEATKPLRKTLFTDGLGRLHLDDAVGRALRIRAEAPGHVPMETVVKSMPADFELSLETGVWIEGEITHVRGRQALEGATVTLTAKGRRQVARTDSLGRYNFKNVPQGKVELRVEYPDYATVTTTVEVKETGRDDRAFDLPRIDLGEAGRVLGRVIDEAGEPVAAARVGVGFVPAYLPRGALPAGLALSNARGEFELSGLEAGTIHIEAYAANVGRGSVDNVEVRAGEDTEEVEIRLVGGDSATPLAAGGVAITLGEQGQEIVIVHVATGSEAERAGLQPGDTLLRIDGTDVTSLSEARTALSGAVGSDVLVEVRRAGADTSFRVRREGLLP